jgi:hypothetical protein
MWRSLLNNDQVVLRMLAIQMLSDNLDQKFEKDLVNIYKTDPAFNVRLIALKCLAQLRSKAFEDILKDSVNDPFELIRRFTVNWMGDVGKEEYLPLIAERYIMDHSDRINFKSKAAIEKISPLKGKQACTQFIDSMPEVASKARLAGMISKSFDHTEEWMDKMLTTIKTDTLKLKKRISTSRTFRNYRFQEAMPELIAFAKDSQQDQALRIHVIEALGWFTFAHDRSQIIKACDDILKENELSQEIRDEAIKTKNRVIEGANNSLTP